MSATFASLSDRLLQRSDALLARLERHAGWLAIGWLVLAGLGSAVRLSGVSDPLAWLPYALFVAAPALAFAIGLSIFSGRVAPKAIASHPLYGAGGLMLSLLFALLACALLRGASFLTAVPAVSSDASPWLETLHAWLTADTVLACTLYALAFAAGLRRAAAFPALLATAWSVDLAMQLLMAQAATAMLLPPAVADAYHLLLRGNLTRLLVSLGIWLPYLLLSERVAVTYRHQLPRIAPVTTDS